MEMQQAIKDFIKVELKRLKGNSELHDQCCYEDFCYGQVVALKNVLEILKAKERNVKTHILVNGSSKEVLERELYYRDICVLADKDPQYIYSISYSHADGNKSEGTIVPGDKLTVKDGTIINCMWTGNA